MDSERIVVRRLRPEDPDLSEIASRLNDKEWEDFDNRFSELSLARFVADEGHIYLVAYCRSQLVGAAHAYLLRHPAGHLVAYIDEVDTLRPFRRRGVATAMMQEMLKLGRAAGAVEAWLGAEDDNAAARALYQSLLPSEVDGSVIFTYRLRGDQPGGS